MNRILPFLILIYLGLAQCTEHTDSNAVTAEDLPPAPTTVNYMLRPNMAGNITANTQPDALKQMFGADQVKDTLVYIGEGESRPGAIVFPGTADALEIVWTETDPKVPELIYIRKQNTQWRAINGLTVGTPLRDLIRLNGGDFNFYGFDWDYGGTVTDWKGGKLNGYMLRLGYRQGSQLPQSLMGDQVISTDHPDADAVPIVVKEIILPLNRSGGE